MTETVEKMKLPKPFLGRALIEAIQTKSVEYLTEQLKGKVGKENFERAQAAGLILDDPDIFRDSMTDEYTGRTILGKRKTDNKVPLNRGKIIDLAPDFGGEKFQNSNGTDVGYVPQIGDIVWFIPNETCAVDTNRQYHLINDCDIVAYEAKDE